METNRLFFAIPSCVEIITASGRLREINSNVKGVRWVPEKNLHLTLLFMGNVLVQDNPHVLYAIKDLLSALQPFTLECNSFSLEGGKHNRPSMIWARFEKREEFRLLHQELGKRVLPFMNEPVKFQDPVPHITIARLHSSEIPDINVKVNCNLEIREFQLWKTIHLPGGVRYEIVK